nr:hypothetical protein [Tanacetum cinerariifolium]
MIVEKQLVLEMLVDESLEMIVDETLDMIDDESLEMILDESLDMIEDESRDMIGFAVALAILITGASQSRQHGVKCCMYVSGTSELILNTDSEGDEIGEEDVAEHEEDQSSDSNDERGRDQRTGVLVPSTFEVGQSSRSVPEHQGAGRISASKEPTLVTWVDPVDGKVYTNILDYVPPVAPIQTPPLSPLLSIGTPSSLEWSSGSFLVSPLSLAISTPVVSPATFSPAASPDTVEAEDFMAQLGAQRYRLRSLEREQERATMTFSALWRFVLALEAWAGQTDAHRVALWHAMSDTQRENHDLRMQLVEERHKRLELADCVARMERDKSLERSSRLYRILDCDFCTSLNWVASVSVGFKQGSFRLVINMN